MNAVHTGVDVAKRVADVLLGGDAQIPVPAALDAVAHQVQSVMGADGIPKVPYIDFTDLALARAIIATILPPLVWNLIGPFEYYTRIASKITFKPIIGVYLSGAIIASLSVYRSALFVAAINSQVRLDEMDTPLFHALGGFFGTFGVSLFLGAYCRLGISGTYLGDYFGIFRDERITAFPFNVVDNPMYDGSSLLHLGESVLERSPTGLLLSIWLFFCYRFGCIFEEPFTAKMYSERDMMLKATKSKAT